jgi:hypothetical protein
MPQQFSNNARSTLTSTISDSATSLTIQAGAADLFPAANVGTGSIPSADNWFKATLQDVSGNVEIIYVRTRTAGSAVFGNILRGQEGTTARTFVAGAIVGLRVTAADIQAAINLLGNNNTFTGSNVFAAPIVGDLTGDVTGNLTGDVTGDLTGDVTGNLTGNVTGNLTGNVTGNVTGNTSGTSGSVATTDWTITQSGTSLVFSYDGTAKLALTSAGAVTSVDNITAYGVL